MSRPFFPNPSQQEELIALAREAGAAIMDVYQSGDFGIEIKADNSPLTLADQASHNVISIGLNSICPDVPVISEEGKMLSRDGWDENTVFWLVDPLDGTKEFTRREKDFTVNLALIWGTQPVFGVVYAPARDWLYVGQCSPEESPAAWKETPEGRLDLPISEINRTSVIAVRSKSHASEEEQVILDAFGVNETVSMGSSLKFCLLAEGKADIYFRHGPTWEWDTAAAHAVLQAAGGAVLLPDASAPLPYNKTTLKNDNGFLALRVPADAATLRIDQID